MQTKAKRKSEAVGGPRQATDAKRIAEGLTALKKALLKGRTTEQLDPTNNTDRFVLDIDKVIHKFQLSRDGSAVAAEKLRKDAERIFGNRQKAKHWLNHPRVQLGGKSPNEAMKSSAGIDAVAEILVQIDHGMFG